MNELKYIFKLMLAGLLALGVAYLFRLQPLSAMLIVFYAMVMVQTTVGATLQVIKSYFVWAAAGLVVGLVVAEILVRFTPTHPDLIWIGLSVLVVYGAIIIPRHKMARLALITAFVIVILGDIKHNPLHEALIRSLSILCSFVIGLAVSYGVFPKKASKVVKTITQGILTDFENIYNQTIHKCLLTEDTKSPSKDKLLKSIVETKSKITKKSGLVEDISLERRDVFAKLISTIITSEYRISSDIVVLIKLCDQVEGNPLIMHTQAQLQKISEQITASLLMWKQVSMDCLIDMMPLSYEHLYEQVDQQLIDYVCHDVHHNKVFYALYHAMQTLASDLNDIILEELNLNKNFYDVSKHNAS